ncbi:DUF4013 domain-containing protein [Halomicrococcus sp. NG-SE-24]|uniref:DUF4013 domain-containing protein n=1 Tax=Halomicrococcus sp. NG-SE-24 TaxID=3436928 RepID=UPI003D95D092
MSDPVRIVTESRGVEAIRSAYGYFRSLPELTTTVLLGGLLWGYGIWLVLPSVFVMGIYIRILQNTSGISAADPQEPSFTNWPQLLSIGAKSYIIWFTYLAIALVGSLPASTSNRQSAELFLALFSSLAGASQFQLLANITNTGETALRESIAFSSIVSPKALLFLIGMYIAPAAMIAFSEENSLRAGFDFSEIKSILEREYYAKHWVLFMLFWLLSTITLWSHTGLLESSTQPVLIGLLRESIEFLRGFLSFIILSMGYIILGQSRAHDTERTVGDIGMEYLASNRFTQLVQKSDRVSRTFLIGVVLTVFHSLPSALFLSGYIAQLLRTVLKDEDQLPTFKNWRQILRDGSIVFGVWSVFGFLSAFFLGFLTLYTPSSVEDLSIEFRPGEQIDFGDLITTATFTIGSPIDAPTMARDLYSFFWFDLQDMVGSYIPIVNRTVPAVLVDHWWIFLLPVLLSYFTLWYFLPIILCIYVSDTDIPVYRAPIEIKKVSMSRVYFSNWLIAASYWLLIAFLFQVWNWWRVAPVRAEKSDTVPIISFKGFSLLEVPSNLGLQSSFLLFIISIPIFFLIIESYLKIGYGVKHGLNK